jgi:hypothetical protein
MCNVYSITSNQAAMMVRFLVINRYGGEVGQFPLRALLDRYRARLRLRSGRKSLSGL